MVRLGMIGESEPQTIKIICVLYIRHACSYCIVKSVNMLKKYAFDLFMAIVLFRLCFETPKFTTIIIFTTQLDGLVLPQYGFVVYLA